MPRTQVICARLNRDYCVMLDDLQRKWGTANRTDTIREAIWFCDGAGYRRCMVCHRGLGPLLAEGVSDGLCPGCNEAEMAKAEEWEGDTDSKPSTTLSYPEGN